MSRSADKKFQPIWGHLAKNLRVQELPDPVKDLLLENHETEVYTALGAWEQDDLDYVVQLAKSLYSAHLSPRRAKRRRRVSASNEDAGTIVPEVGQYESLRAAVLSDYLAKMAAIEPSVVRFRNDVLNGELLTPDEARTFLLSPATRCLDLAVWRTHGIPAKHTATLLDENRGHTADGPFYWVRIRTDPPGKEHALFMPNPQGYDNFTLTKDGRPRRVTFWTASVLGDLRKLCKEMTRSHPWNTDEAAWFVLTEENPVLRPIRAKINHSWIPGTRAHTTISLDVQPWVPPETVELAYRSLQRRAIGGECGRIGNKNLKLLEFATKRADANGNLPRGDVLVQEWDRKWRDEHPEWCYTTDKRRFWRDLRSVQGNLTNSRRAGLFLDAAVDPPEEYMPQG